LSRDVFLPCTGHKSEALSTKYIPVGKAAHLRIYFMDHQNLRMKSIRD